VCQRFYLLVLPDLLVNITSILTMPIIYTGYTHHFYLLRPDFLVTQFSLRIARYPRFQGALLAREELPELGRLVPCDWKIHGGSDKI